MVNLQPKLGLSAPIVTSIPKVWDAEWFRRFITNYLDISKSYFFSYEVTIATNGGNKTISANTSDEILDPAGTIASFTVTLPATPVDGWEQTISSSHIITALTISPNTGQTIVDNISTLGVGGSVTFKYVLPTTKWYRIGN